MKAWPMLPAVVRHRTSQHPRISLDPGQSRFFRRDRIWSSRTCEARIPWAPARCAQASCAFGISRSGVAEFRAVGLRLGIRSFYPPLGRAGPQNSQLPRGDNVAKMISTVRSRWSILLTFRKLIVGQTCRRLFRVLAVQENAAARRSNNAVRQTAANPPKASFGVVRDPCARVPGERAAANVGPHATGEQQQRDTYHKHLRHWEAPCRTHNVSAPEMFPALRSRLGAAVPRRETAASLIDFTGVNSRGFTPVSLFANRRDRTVDRAASRRLLQTAITKGSSGMLIVQIVP